MNISRKWLREFVDITATDKEYDSVMTLAGQKVETTERMDAEIKNVVVGKVLSMKKHENSDHMWVCQVDVGDGEPIQIVTGAQNVNIGDLVPVGKCIDLERSAVLPGVTLDILGQLGASSGVILYNGNVHVFLLFLFYRRCFFFLLSFYLTKKKQESTTPA